jgi:hypothetical protein
LIFPNICAASVGACSAGRKASTTAAAL